MIELFTEFQLTYINAAGISADHLIYIIKHIANQDVKYKLNLGQEEVVNICFEICVSLAEGSLCKMYGSFKHKVHVAGKLVREGRWQTPFQTPLSDIEPMNQELSKQLWSDVMDTGLNYH